VGDRLDGLIAAGSLLLFSVLGYMLNRNLSQFDAQIESLRKSRHDTNDTLYKLELQIALLTAAVEQLESEIEKIERRIKQ